jgi:hypothetical protein
MQAGGVAGIAAGSASLQSANPIRTGANALAMTLSIAFVYYQAGGIE